MKKIIKYKKRKRQVRVENSSISVAFRGSKTFVFKFPIETSYRTFRLPHSTEERDKIV